MTTETYTNIQNQRNTVGEPIKVMIKNNWDYEVKEGYQEKNITTIENHNKAREYPTLTETNAQYHQSIYDDLQHCCCWYNAGDKTTLVPHT